MFPFQPACWQGLTVCHQSAGRAAWVWLVIVGMMAEVVWRYKSLLLLEPRKALCSYSRTFKVGQTGQHWQESQLRVCPPTHNYTDGMWHNGKDDKEGLKNAGEAGRANKQIKPSLWRLLSYTSRIFHGATGYEASRFWCVFFPVKAPGIPLVSKPPSQIPVRILKEFKTCSFRWIRFNVTRLHWSYLTNFSRNEFSTLT